MVEQNYTDRAILRELVNRNFSFADFHSRFENVFNANIYCPFHEHSYTGNGNAKMYFNEMKNMFELRCFVEHRTYTAYDYVELIYCKKKGKYKNVTSFLIDKLGKNNFITEYKIALSNLNHYKETLNESKTTYIENVYAEAENLTEYIERLYDQEED